MFCCLRNCFETIGINSSHYLFKKEENPISLDITHMGQEVVIVKNGLRICGRGGALANAPLVQSKSYFEVKIQQDGIWSIGIATRSTDLNSVVGGSDSESWVLNSEGILKHNNEEIQKVEASVQEGDVIGVSYDHIELHFFINGKAIDVSISGIKGTTFPVLYVDDGAILDLILDNFTHSPPSGFDKIMLEQSLL